jgi:8-oxo-dGTP diphosphatase
MARVPVLAAGGIVLRRQQPPLVAVVRLRKRDEWVLPKGKLDDGETPRAAAKREVLEETGHNVTVHEFLGTLVYDSGGRAKIVHYWRMEAAGEQTHELMDDIRAVDWLPLNAAVERLSRSHERVFLANVGPQALSAHARRQKAKGLAKGLANGLASRLVSAAPASRRRRGAGVVAPQSARAERLAKPMPVEPMPAEPMAQPHLSDSVAERRQVETISVPPQVERTPRPVAAAEVEPIVNGAVAEPRLSPGPDEIAEARAETAAAARPPSADAENGGSIVTSRSLRSLAQKVRDWLGRAA